MELAVLRIDPHLGRFDCSDSRRQREEFRGLLLPVLAPFLWPRGLAVYIKGPILCSRLSSASDVETWLLGVIGSDNR